MTETESRVANGGDRPRVILIADDLTGAADSGVTFAKAGAEVVVGWDPADIPDADVVVLSTESRHQTPAKARHRVATVMAALSGLLSRQNPPLIYKKVDSTLRGHPALELATVVASLNAGLSRELSGISVNDAPGVAAGSSFGGRLQERACPTLVAPAFPAQGRVTRDGVHYVHDVPLAETVFAAKSTSSRVADHFRAVYSPESVRSLPLAVLHKGGAALRAALCTSGDMSSTSLTRVIVADAVTEADLLALATAAVSSGLRCFCGSAGLAEALAQRLARAHSWPASPVSKPASHGVDLPVLVVAASRHPQTRRQVEMVRKAGIPVITPPVAWFSANHEGDAFIRELRQALAAGVVVLTTVGLPDMSGSGEALVAHLAQVVAALSSGDTQAAAASFGLVVTGGDTAIAVSRALGARALRLQGEVVSGMPWGYLIGVIPGDLPVVTKAGGFGDPHALMQAIQFLRGVDDD